MGVRVDAENGTNALFWIGRRPGLQPLDGRIAPFVVLRIRWKSACVSLTDMDFWNPLFEARMGAARSQLSGGFTLLEMLIVVAIGAILALISVPSMRASLDSMRQNSAVGLVVGDLNMARGEAIKRNARMLMCVRDAAGQQCGTGTDWRAGWVVCVASPGSNQCLPFNPAPGPTDEPNPLTVRPPLDSALTLGASAAAIRFNPNSSQGADGTAATLTVGGTSSSLVARPVTVTIANTGNISSSR